MLSVLPAPAGVEAVADDLGAKAAGLLELAAIGVPVPEAVIVPGSHARAYRNGGRREREQLVDRVVEASLTLAAGLQAPIPLVSLRCAAKSSPGTRSLPESVLNLGADRIALQNAVARGCTPAFVGELQSGLSAHARRFFEFFGLALPPAFLEMSLADQLRTLLVCLYERATARQEGVGAVIVQRMVFGNIDHQSLTGMCYTRHPHTGACIDYGHFILHRQGMSLGGIVSSDQLDLSLMPQHNPSAYAQLKAICRRIEEHYRDVRALEYTAQAEQLFILQNTTGKRTFRLAHEGQP